MDCIEHANAHAKRMQSGNRLFEVGPHHLHHGMADGIAQAAQSAPDRGLRGLAQELRKIGGRQARGFNPIANILEVQIDRSDGLVNETAEPMDGRRLLGIQA